MPAALAKSVTDVAWVTPDPPESVDVGLWRDVWELGGPSGVYHPVADFQVVRRWCELVGRRDAMLAELELVGWTSMGSQGQVVAHPLARLVADVEAKLVPLEDRLGLNPQARHTIQVGVSRARSALEEWLGVE